jgi:glyoxylase-like metal-dependent hydrolase (beta-lactamase superfamily II)
MEVAPRIHRVGTGLVNSYFVEEAGRLTMVDTGLPGQWKSILRTLADMGKSVSDIDAVFITHSHLDHTGSIERLRRATGGRVIARVHPLDIPEAMGERSMMRDPNRPPEPFPPLTNFFSFLFSMVRLGLTGAPKVVELTRQNTGAVLDVPGSPTVIATPGHTLGSSSLHFAGHDALLPGDAISMTNPLKKIIGPTIVLGFAADARAAMGSLDALTEYESRYLLTGHGEPWTGGVAAAVRIAKAGAPPLPPLS